MTSSERPRRAGTSTPVFRTQDLLRPRRPAGRLAGTFELVQRVAPRPVGPVGAGPGGTAA